MAEGSDESERNFKSFKRLDLLVFGGTGPSGQEVVKQALKLGHEVTVIAREPTKFQIQHQSLKVVKGDAYHIETFESELTEKDAVLSCLGSPALGPFATTTLYSATIKFIIEAMKKCYVSRLVVITSWCTKKDPNNLWFFEWILRPFIIGGSLNDMAVMEDIIMNTDAAEINYTIVRPPRLTYGPVTGNYKIEEGLFNTRGTTSNQISRADVAHFMLTALQTDEYDRKEISIGSP